jgi:flagellar biosynthesis protein FlhF
MEDRANVHMKSYFTSSFQAAMAQARRELGPDAVLITNRPAAPEARHLGEYEVVFATEVPEPGQAEAALADDRVALPPGREHSEGTAESMLAEIRDLRRQFQAWRQFSLRASDQPRWVAGDPQLAEAFDTLAHAEMDRDLILRILAGVQNRLRHYDGGFSGEPAGLRQSPKWELAQKSAPLDAASVWVALSDEVQDAFRVDAALGAGTGESRITALVGPPGAGKTATIAKLAVKYGLSTRKPAMLISVDTLRVAASEQLRWYASILGTGFQVVETGRALAQTLEEHPGKSLILIDTPGFTFADLKGGCDIADFLARRGDIQKQLVLPASMRSGDLTRISAAYDIFQPSHLIFTRIDETEAIGPVLGEAMRSGRPVSFLGTGQRVPEDLETASKAGLLNRLLSPAETNHAALAAA